MIYLPNSYNIKKIKETFENMDSFTKYQRKYQRLMGYLLRNLIDIELIDKYMDGIPKCKDSEYNFYHNKEVLNSDYLFLRNNIHVENLNESELKLLNEISEKDDYIPFLNQTMFRVIGEDNNVSCYGYDLYENMVESYNLIFELAYNMAKFENMEQTKQVNGAYDKIKMELDGKLIKHFRIGISLVKYSMMPDLFIENGKKNVVIK